MKTARWQRILIVALLAGPFVARPSSLRAAPCSPEGSFRLRAPFIVYDVRGVGWRVEGFVARYDPYLRAITVNADVAAIEQPPGAEGGRVTLSGPLTSRGPRKRMRLAADLGGPNGSNLVLRATLRRCRRLDGLLIDGLRGSRLRFHGVRARCGDGVADIFAGEDCEDQDACAPGTCTSSCTCQGSGGLLDPGFGQGGVVRTVLSAERTCPARFCDLEGIEQLAVQPDGRILALGVAQPVAVAPPVGVLVRYTASGALDPSFGNGGVIYTFQGRMQLQPDGSIFIAGRPGGYPFAGHFVVHITHDGAVDPAFSSSSFGSGGTEVTDVTVLADGTILTIASGEVDQWSSKGDFVGALPLPSDLVPLAFDPADRIVARELGSNVRLQRLSPDGAIDPSFGGGMPVCAILVGGGAQGETAGLAILPSAEIFVRYSLTTPPTSAPSSSRGVVRIAADGGDSGAFCVPPPPLFSDGPLPQAVQLDGKLVALDSNVLSRHHPDGQLDRTFARLGRLELGRVGGLLVIGRAVIAITPDGAILASGVSDVDGRDAFTIARYLP